MAIVFLGGATGRGLPTIERAYELARSGKCLNVREIKLQLKIEGFDDYTAQLHGRAITVALRRLCAEAVGRVDGRKRSVQFRAAPPLRSTA